MKVYEQLARGVGIVPSSLSAVGECLISAVAHREVPGAVMVAGIKEHTLVEVATGFAVDMPPVQMPMTLDTVFDLASLTKVCATLPALLALIDDGELLLSDPVARFIPAFDDPIKRGVTIRHLLTHTSGLPAGEPLHLLANAQEAWTRLPMIPLLEPQGKKVVYSDIGFLLLGQIVEAVSGQPLQRYVHERIFTSLEMKSTGYRPIDPQSSCAQEPAYPPGIAATEVQSESGIATCGRVHDENAYALGGVAGHAGLFSDARDLVRYIQMWLGCVQEGVPSVLSSAVRRLATDCHTDGLNGQRGLGWCLRGDSYDHMGDSLSRYAFGHTGFTGTSLTMDPQTGLWMVLLTNRVHYGRECDPSRLRRRLHNRLASICP